MEDLLLLDVQVKTDDGIYIDIEVQNGYKEDLADRMVVYGANMITRYSEKSTKYSSDKCIAIWILNCNIPAFKQFDNDPIIGAFDFRSRINPSNYLQMKELTIYPVQLKKGLKILDLSPEKQTWINFLRTSENNSTPVEIVEIHNAYNKMKITTGSAAYRNYEEAAKKMDRLKAIDIEDAKNKGKEEGIVEVKKEERKQLALNMSNQGFDDDTIAKCLNN